VIVSSEVAEVKVEFSVKLVGLRLVVSPDGKEKAERLMVPENPDPVRVIVELPDEPGFKIIKIGLAVRLKEAPVTRTWTNTVRLIVPLVPVTATP